MGPNVSGEMPSAEMWRSNQIAARAIYGHGKWSFVALIALALALYWILVKVLDRLPWAYEHPNLTTVSYFVTMAVLVVGAVFLFNRRLKSALRKRGERSSFPLTFSIEDRGLKLTTAMSESVTFWSSFGELTHNAHYWILIIERSAFMIPKRFFLDEAAERDFISTLWTRLPEEARARSSKAARYIAEAV